MLSALKPAESFNENKSWYSQINEAQLSYWGASLLFIPYWIHSTLYKVSRILARIQEPTISLNFPLAFVHNLGIPIKYLNHPLGSVYGAYATCCFGTIILLLDQRVYTPHSLSKTLRNFDPTLLPNACTITMDISHGSAFSFNDILCGRGHTLRTHPGNICFREKVHKHSAQYAQAISRHGTKASIVAKISEELKANGAVFLKQQRPGVWRELSAEQVRQKVRDRRR